MKLVFLRFLLLIMMLGLVGSIKSTSEAYEVDKSTFTVTNKHKEYDRYTDTNNIYDTHYFFYCKNNLGYFKIDVDEESYNRHSIGSNIVFTNNICKYELYNYAVNDYTRDNILKSVKSNFVKKYISDNGFNFLLTFIWVISSVLFLVGIFSILNTDLSN